MHIHLIHWLANFIGINDGQNKFSTQMYNFWSGFGGNISILAVAGTTFGVYRQHAKHLSTINLLHHIHKKQK
jgi:hypothetical protein